MSNERIDLEYLLEEDSLLQDLNWSIARFEQVEKLVKEMTAELKRCYDLINKMQESIVKNTGDCWDCDMPIDSCDARNCERQMLEDIEWRSASE